MFLIALLQETALYAILGKVGAVFAATVTVFAAAGGISKIGKSAMEAISRQPEAGDSIRMSMIIAGALVEGVSLFAIIVALLVAL